MRRHLILLVLMAFALIACSADSTDSAGPGIDVIDVSGPLDASALRFMISSIENAAAAGQELAILQINSRAVLDMDGFSTLENLVSNPPLPVAVWLGPNPAFAYGGAATLVLESPVAAAAPGSRIGKASPTFAGTGPGSGPVVNVEEAGLELQPTIRQYLQELDGRSLHTSSGDVVVSTLRPFTADGVEGITVKPVTFRKPGLITRFFRLAATPEAAFFFLVVGLTLVTFEFYALGPGVAAGVAALSLWIGGWGIVNLPVRWWALGLAVLGWMALTTGYQRGGVVGLTAIGAVLLQVAGVFYVEGSGQIDARWWLILLSVLAALFFFLLAMPTVQRSRLSTQTIGRESLIGSIGRALTDFDPDGTVVVNGARWRATAHREAGLTAGAPIRVSGVDGLFLEVEPPEAGDAKTE